MSDRQQASAKNESAPPTTKTKTTLLIVDAQNDFHPPGGSLAIPSALEDADRIAAFISLNAHSINRIVLTMDTHQKMHIANPCFWTKGGNGRDGEDGDGQDDKQRHLEHPDPFTIISSDDLRKGKWKPRPDLDLSGDDCQVDPAVFPGLDSILVETKGDGGSAAEEEGRHRQQQKQLDLQKYCVEYASRLEEKGRFRICIWPEHCLIGSKGHALVDRVHRAVHGWTELTGRSPEFVAKGQHLLTEMYSALEADVPVSGRTAFNEPLFDSLLRGSDRLLVCGQAMSHCVNYTVRDIVSRWPSERMDRITLLVDCASSVPGFESASEAFLKDMEREGIQIVKSTDVQL